MPMTPEFCYDCDLRSGYTTVSYSTSDHRLDPVVLRGIQEAITVL